MITGPYLHGGEARWRVFLVTDGRFVDLCHPLFEGLFLLGGHLLVRLLASNPRLRYSNMTLLPQPSFVVVVVVVVIKIVYVLVIMLFLYQPGIHQGSHSIHVFGIQCGVKHGKTMGKG